VEAEKPQVPSARVVLEVVDEHGNPKDNLAYNLRQHIDKDGMVARVPTPTEQAFLKDLKKKRGYGKGGFVIEG
jgi:hypothetical protein